MPNPGAKPKTTCRAGAGRPKGATFVRRKDAVGTAPAPAGSRPPGIASKYGMLVRVVVSPSKGNGGTKKDLGPGLGELTFEEMLNNPVVKRSLNLLVRDGMRTGGPAGVSREDVVSEALWGAIKAFESYDPSKNSSFATWLGYQVRGKLTRFLSRELMSKRISLRQANRHRSISQALLVYQGQRAEEPPLKEGREMLEALRNGNATEGEVEEKLRKVGEGARRRVVYLDQNLPGENETTYLYLADRVNSRDWEEPDPEREDREAALNHAISASLDSLDPRERLILEERHFNSDGGKPALAELGRRFGISRERVRQLEAIAKEKLGHYFAARPELAHQIDGHVPGFREKLLGRYGQGDAPAKAWPERMSTDEKIRVLRRYGLPEHLVSSAAFLCKASAGKIRWIGKAKELGLISMVNTGNIQRCKTEEEFMAALLKKAGRPSAAPAESPRRVIEEYAEVLEGIDWSSMSLEELAEHVPVKELILEHEGFPRDALGTELLERLPLDSLSLSMMLAKRSSDPLEALGRYASMQKGDLLKLFFPPASPLDENERNAS